MDGTAGRLNLFGQCVSSRWNAWRHSRRHNGTLYPDYEREPRNSMKRFVGMSKVGFIRIGSPNSIRYPFWLFILSSPSFSFRNDVSPAARFLSHWTLKYYSSFRFRGASRDIRVLFVTSKKRRGIVDNVLLYFLSHDRFACALYIARDIQKDIPMFCGRFQKICDICWNLRTCLLLL